MPTRNQLTKERLDALIDVLQEAGIIDENLNRELSTTRDFGEARDVATKANAADRAGDVSPVDLGE